MALASADETGTTQTYLVVFNGSRTDSAAIDHAGGTVVVAYDQIGVAVARSDRAGSAASLRQVTGVDGVSATADFGVRVADAEADATAEDATAAATWGDTLSAWQWDMTQIKVPEAHAVTTGGPDVIVADLDTGLDFTHPDLAPNYDASRSADCSGGTPTPLLPGNDRNGHGTHTAGTIAAAANGIGIVGVAPSVKIAGVKTSNDDGFFFPEMVVCAFMWAATHGIDITNNSYFADPWLFNCLNDKAQPSGPPSGARSGTRRRAAPWSSRPRGTSASTCPTRGSTPSARTSRPTARLCVRSRTRARSFRSRCPACCR